MVKQHSTGWVGWIYFASVLLLLGGGLQIIAGLTGIFNGNFYEVANGTLLVFDYGTWGWIHLILGVALLAAGAGLMTGQGWARVVATIIVVMSIIGNIAFLPIYPWWSLIALIIDAFVVYAVTIHGDEVAR